MSAMDWLSRAVAQADKLYPYVPGKPVEQLLREKGLTSAIKLASNENPYGSSPLVAQAISQAATQVHRYPDGDSTELKAALAKHYDVNVEQILLGNGSNEVLELIIRTFAGAGDEVIYSQRGFIVYALVTVAAAANAIPVGESDGLSHDLKAMAAAVTEHTKVVCVANPNNPTGTLHDHQALQVFLNDLPRDVVVIIDEAYYEFVADTLGNSIETLSHPGLVISRTFSKAYGLAGLRVGYAIADADLIAVVNRFREPFNVNMMAQKAAVAALNDNHWVMDKVAKNNDERTRLEQSFDDLGVLGGKSFGNFVLLQHTQASLILQKLESKGMIPRPLAAYGMVDYLRITVGTEAENELLLAELSPILAEMAE